MLIFSSNSKRLTERIVFPIENSTLTLIIYGQEQLVLDRGPVRQLLSNAYTFVSNVVDIAGDGYLPRSADPFEDGIAGAYLVIANIGPDFHRLKWSHVKDVLWGLREFMVVQGHLFETGFFIRNGQYFDEELGFGRVQHESSLGMT